VGKKRNRPWYTKYPQLIERLSELKEQFITRCAQLELEPHRVLQENWAEIAVQAVQESNWQEGIYVEYGRTRELAMHLFQEATCISGPHLDVEAIMESHKRQVIKLKRAKVSLDEIAAHNLSAVRGQDNRGEIRRS
jgi:L-lactate utilization protein LutC